MTTTNTDAQQTTAAAKVGTPIFNMTPTLAIVFSVVGVGLAFLNTVSGLPAYVYSALAFILPLGNLIGIWSAGPRYQAPNTPAPTAIEPPKPSV